MPGHGCSVAWGPIRDANGCMRITCPDITDLRMTACSSRDLRCRLVKQGTALFRLGLAGRDPKPRARRMWSEPTARFWTGRRVL